MARAFWGQGGGSGHGKVVLGSGRESWVQGGDPGHGCSELGSSLECGEHELTPLLDKQALAGH